VPATAKKIRASPSAFRLLGVSVVSIKLMTQVYERDVGGIEQSLLLCLADFANDDGTRIFPSVARVAWRLGASRATVQRHMAHFRAIGVLKVVEEGGGRGSTVYTLDLSALPKKPPFKA
jgi:Helix-turn-helix domain